VDDIRARKLPTRCNRCQRLATGEVVGEPCGAETPPLVLRGAGTCAGRMNVGGYPLHDVGWKSWHDQQIVVPGD
jgi:hypothetical protein